MTDLQHAQWQREPLYEKLTQRLKDTPDWFQKWRQQALDLFLQKGFPTRKDEQWKYTNIAKLTHHHFDLASRAFTIDVDISNYALENSYTFVFVDGIFMPELSSFDDLPSSVILTNFKSALADHEALLQSYSQQMKDSEQSVFSHLNAALLTDGMFLYVPKDTVLAKPVHLLHINSLESTDRMTHPRHLIIAENRAKLTVFEEYTSVGGGYYFNNVVTQIFAKANAHIQHFKLQHENLKSYHIANISIDQQKASRVNTYYLATGANLSRDDLHFLLRENDAHCELNGFYYTKSKQHIDNHTRVDHRCSNTTSQQLYKGIMTEFSRAVFNGKIHVHPNIQQVSAEQTNKNLLLSEQAEIDTKPELEIYSEDVRCSHGATVGQLDENALFYLRSRGIKQQEAKHLLTRAFADEVFQTISDQQIVARFQAHIATQLSDQGVS